MSSSSPKILLTGATGWLGLRCARALAQGLPDVPALAEPQGAGPIRCLVQRGAAREDLLALGARIECVAGDLLDGPSLASFLQGAEGATLYACSGLVHPRLLVRDLFRVNVEGTRNLLEAAEAAGVRRVVLMSSNSSQGINAHRHEVFDEDSPCRPYLSYGRSKLQMEQIARQVDARGDLETVIVRAPWFYGPNQPPRQTLFFTMIKEGRAPLVGRGDNRRSMAYVDNLAHGLLLAGRTPEARGRTYWIADERPYTMKEVIDTVEDLLANEFGVAVRGKRLRLPHLVPRLARGADRLLQSCGLYQQKIHVLGEMDRTIACSIGRARRELGYEPAIALPEGMRRSIADLLQRGIAI